MPQFQGFAFVMNGGTCATQRAMNVHLYNSFIELQWKTGTKAQNVATLSDTFVTFAMASFNIMSHCMHCVFLQGYNLYAIVHWLSFRHMSGYQSITKEAIFWGTFFSIEEAFEFC